MKYWKRIDKDGATTTVESYSFDLDIDGAVGIEKEEFDSYIDSLPEPILQPKRDLATEIDALKLEVEALKK